MINTVSIFLWVTIQNNACLFSFATIFCRFRLHDTSSSRYYITWANWYCFYTPAVNPFCSYLPLLTPIHSELSMRSIKFDQNHILIYIYMYVYVYIYTYTYIHIYIYIYMYICICIHIYIYTAKKSWMALIFWISPSIDHLNEEDICAIEKKSQHIRLTNTCFPLVKFNLALRSQWIWGSFWFGKPYLWIAPSIDYHCVPCVMGKEKGKGKGERILIYLIINLSINFKKKMYVYIYIAFI